MKRINIKYRGCWFSGYADTSVAPYHDVVVSDVNKIKEGVNYVVLYISGFLFSGYVTENKLAKVMR